ncbi:MAG: TonB-dependent receptor [bacterium]
MRFIVFISLLLPIGSASAQSTSIHGTVLDKKTHEPIAGASIEVLNSEKHSLRKQSSKVSGEFNMSIQFGEFFRMSALGYRDTIIEYQNDFFPYIFYLTQQPLRGEDVIVTAQRHTTAVQDVPISVSVVRNEEITERSPEAADHILRYIPGVSVTESQINIRGSSGYARSVGSRVLFLLDGMPFLSGDNGDIKFDALPIMNIDRIEVVKGAGSALYGSNALGGVINVITRKPEDYFHGRLSAAIGAYDNVKYSEWKVPGLQSRFAFLEGGATGSVGETGILGSMSFKRNEGYRLGDDSYKSSGFAKLTTPLSSHDRFEASVLLANENHGGFLYWKDLNHALLPADSLGAVNGRIHSFKGNILASLESILSEHFVLSSKASALFTNFTTDASVPGSTAGPHSSAANYSLDVQSNTDIADSLFLTSGLVGQYQSVSSDLYQLHHGITYGGFAQAEYKLSPLILTLGLRGDAVNYDDSGTIGSISPKFGATLNLTSDLTFRTSIGGGFRSPTIGEKYIDQTFSGFHVVPNPTLIPEKSYSAELGGSYRSEHFFLDGAIFYSSFDHLIEAQFITQRGVAVIQFNNLTAADLFGHEEVIEIYPLTSEDLLFRLGYTYVFPRDRTTKQILNFRPRHLFQSRVETNIGHLNLSSDFRYISRYESVDPILIQQVPNGDQLTDAYIWDARIAYKLKWFNEMPITLSLQVQNLLNYYYVEIVGNLAPIRNFSFRVETNF